MEREQAVAAPARSRLVEWILHHDESRAFVAGYIGLALVLSIWIGLFWLVAVVAVHLLFETIKQHDADRRPLGVAARVLWELKLDLALVLFALALSVYLEVVLGLAGLSAGARVGLQSGARFAAWQKVLKGVLLSVDDAAQVGRALLTRRGGSPSDDESSEPFALWGGWPGRWSFGDRLAVGLGALCLTLLLAAPMLTDHTWPSLVSVLAAELRPLPQG